MIRYLIRYCRKPVDIVSATVPSGFFVNQICFTRGASRRISNAYVSPAASNALSNPSAVMASGAMTVALIISLWEGVARRGVDNVRQTLYRQLPETSL